MECVMNVLEENGNAYEWAEFNLPSEAIIGPQSMSPLARVALAKSGREAEASQKQESRNGVWQLGGTAALLQPGLLLRP
jgi:hypothetical protein